MAGKTYTAIDPVKLGQTVVIWVYIQIASEAMLALAYAYGTTPAGMRPIDSEGVTMGDMVVGLPALAYLIALVVGGFLGLKWIYRVNRNAHSFAKGLSISPPWSVGWFFVPVASLWKPYEAMGEAWQASERPQRWRTAPKPSFLGWWWAAWLASNFLGYVSGVVGRYTDDLQVIGAFSIMSAVVAIPADLLFIRLVKRLTEMQHHQIAFGVFDEDGPASDALQPAIATAQG